MLIIPTSRIILLKNPIEIDNLNQLTFSSREAQFNYFYNLPKIECDEATYQRKDDVVRFPTDPTLEGITYDDLIQYNYCMYQNDKWSNKWFYAFVKKVTFDNPGMSYIELETDVYQTWMFDITYKPSFIEREHVEDDTIGLHTIPEGLETGDFIVNEVGEFFDVSTLTTIIGVTKSASGLPGFNTYGKTYNNIYSGLTYYGFNDNTDAGIFIKGYDRIGHRDDIYNMFVLPRAMINLTMTTLNICYDDTQTVVETCQGALITDNTIPYTIVQNKLVEINNKLNGYTPRNNKLFTGDYNYLYVTNNAGSDVKFNYEDFVSNEPRFRVDGVLCVGGSIKLFPLNYKIYNTGATGRAYWDLFPYGITGGKFPVCSWASDTYINWLTQNGVNMDVTRAQNSFNRLSNLDIYSGETIGTQFLLPGVNDIINQMKEKRSHSFLPIQASGNVNSGDIALSDLALGFQYEKMSVRYEYAEIIDQFFDMYGYKVNKVKLPNITGRTNWNYVKTIGCNIIGNIPQSDIEKIKEMFNRGVTLWHNPSTFLDYSQSNTIIT